MLPRWAPRPAEAHRGQTGLGQGPDSASVSEDPSGNGPGKEADQQRAARCTRVLRAVPLPQVFYYMGVDALQESLLVDEAAVNSALVSLSHALQLEPGESLPDLHMLRGRCLLLKGEEQNAADCFKKAMELERPGGRDTKALRCLLQALVALFMQGGPDPSQAITQLELWVQKAEETYPEDSVKAELRRLYRTHTSEVTELSRALVRTGRLSLVRRLLETLVPKQLRKKAALGRSFSYA